LVALPHFSVRPRHALRRPPCFPPAKRLAVLLHLRAVIGAGQAFCKRRRPGVREFEQLIECWHSSSYNNARISCAEPVEILSPSIQHVFLRDDTHHIISLAKPILRDTRNRL